MAGHFWSFLLNYYRLLQSNSTFTPLHTFNKKGGKPVSIKIKFLIKKGARRNGGMQPHTYLNSTPHLHRSDQLELAVL